MKYLLILLPLGLGLAGCASDGAQIVVTAPPQITKTQLKKIIPSSMLQCLRKPDGSRVTTVRQAAKYVIDLEKTGDDCRQKLYNVRDIILHEQ